MTHKQQLRVNARLFKYAVYDIFRSSGMMVYHLLMMFYFWLRGG